MAYAAHYAMGVQPVFDMFRTVTGAGPVVAWDQRLPRARRAIRVQRWRRANRRAQAAGEGARPLKTDVSLTRLKRLLVLARRGANRDDE
jgi:hypothetical protein